MREAHITRRIGLWHVRLNAFGAVVRFDPKGGYRSGGEHGDARMISAFHVDRYGCK